MSCLVLVCDVWDVCSRQQNQFFFRLDRPNNVLSQVPVNAFVFHFAFRLSPLELEVLLHSLFVLLEASLPLLAPLHRLLVDHGLQLALKLYVFLTFEVHPLNELILGLLGRERSPGQGVEVLTFLRLLLDLKKN